MFENLKNDDNPSLRCLCAETIGFLCAKSDALKLLYNKPDLLKRAVNIMGKVVVAPRETDILKARILESFATMIAHDPGDVEISMICEKLFQQISHEPIGYLLKLAQQPFLEIRYGALKTLISVSVFSWVEQDMALCAGNARVFLLLVSFLGTPFSRAYLAFIVITILYVIISVIVKKLLYFSRQMFLVNFFILL